VLKAQARADEHSQEGREEGKANRKILKLWFQGKMIPGFFNGARAESLRGTKIGAWNENRGAETENRSAETALKIR